MKLILRIFGIIFGILFLLFFIYSAMFYEYIQGNPFSKLDFSFSSGASLANNLELYQPNRQEFSIFSLSGSTFSKSFDRDSHISGMQGFFSLRDFSKTYRYSGSGYRIELLTPGEFYIDSTQNDAVFIQNFSSLMKIEFLSPSQEKYSEIVLYPHMYSFFKPSRGVKTKNVDRIRMQTFFDIGLSYDFQTTPGKTYIGEKYLSKNPCILAGKSLLQEKREKAQKNMQEFYKTQLIQVPLLTSTLFTEKLFQNPEKKRIFIQNSLVNLLIRQSDSKEKNELYQKYITLFPEKSSELQDFLDFLESENVLAGGEKYFSFSHINAQSEYSYNLYRFFSHDTNIKEKDSEEIEKFLETETKMVMSKNEKFRAEYYLFFLEKNLNYFLDFALAQDGKKILSFYENFNDMNGFIYSGNNSQGVTGIYVQVEIISKILSYIRDSFFEKERTQDFLLVLQNQGNLKVDDFTTIKEQIKNSFDFISKYSSALNPDLQRDEEILSNISSLQENFAEYFLAMEDYETYSFQYDEVKRKFLEQKENEVITSNLNIKDFYDYMSQFQNVSLTSAKVNIVNGSFVVEDIQISGQIFSFTLTPKGGNILSDISVGGNKITSSYILDEQEKKGKGEENSGGNSTGNTYDFSYFFYYTFLSHTTTQVEIYNPDEVSPEEDKAEIVFKRDILTGKSGIFSPYKDILELDYDNVILQRNERENNYDIQIQDALIHIPLDTKTKISGKWSAKLLYDEKESYLENFSISLDNNYFLGASLQIKGKIPLKNSVMIFQELGKTLFVYGQIPEGLFSDSRNFAVSYTYSAKKLSIKFEKNGNVYTMLLTQDEISQLLKGNKRLISSPVSPEKISQYFK